MKHYAFYCTPNSGLLDAWIPIFKKLKKTDPNCRFIFVAANPRIFEDLIQNKFLFEESCKIFDGFICQITNNLWIEGLPFISSKFAIMPNLVKKIEKFCAILESVSFGLSKILFIYFWLFLNLTKEFYLMDKNKIKSRFCSLFYDAAFAPDAFPKLLLNIPRFSLSTGVYGTNYFSDRSQAKSLLIDNIKLRKSFGGSEVIFTVSENEYQKFLPLKNQCTLYKVIFPKHNRSWINYVQKNDFDKPEFSGKPFVLVISKAGSNGRLSKEKKIQFINAIKKVIVDEMKLPIIIKLHPIERSESFYQKSFGLNNYRITWAISSKHQYQLSKNCLFAISLMSNVSLDLLAAKVPVIELSNTKNMSSEDMLGYFGSTNKNVRGFFRDNKFVLGADSESELRDQALKMMRSRMIILNKSYNTYKNYFKYNKRSISFIVNKIQHYELH